MSNQNTKVTVNPSPSLRSTQGTSNIHHLQGNSEGNVARHTHSSFSSQGFFSKIAKTGNTDGVPIFSTKSATNLQSNRDVTNIPAVSSKMEPTSVSNIANKQVKHKSTDIVFTSRSSTSPGIADIHDTTLSLNKGSRSSFPTGQPTTRAWNGVSDKTTGGNAQRSTKGSSDSSSLNHASTTASHSGSIGTMHSTGSNDFKQTTRSSAGGHGHNHDGHPTFIKSEFSVDDTVTKLIKFPKTLEPPTRSIATLPPFLDSKDKTANNLSPTPTVASSIVPSTSDKISNGK